MFWVFDYQKWKVVLWRLVMGFGWLENGRHFSLDNHWNLWVFKVCAFNSIAAPSCSVTGGRPSNQWMLRRRQTRRCRDRRLFCMIILSSIFLPSPNLILSSTSGIKKIYIIMYKNLFVAGCPAGQFPGN